MNNFPLSFVHVDCPELILEISGLAQEIWHQHYTPILGKNQVEYMLEKFQSPTPIQESINNDNFFYYLLKTDFAYAGYVGVQLKDNSLFLSKLYILDVFRGRGLARKSMEFIENLCSINSVDKIWLTCNIHNQNTLAVYEKFDFKITEQKQVDIGEGYIMDDYILEKQLSI